MGLKAIAFLGAFLVCCIGAFVAPQLGLYGYVGSYMLGPERSWWAGGLAAAGLRISFSLAMATLLGMILHRNRLSFGRTFLVRQESLMLAFCAVLYLLYLFGESTTGRYEVYDNPAEKFGKILMIVLIMTHLLTDRNKIGNLFWVFIVCGLLLGFDAWTTPRRAFVSGRLEGIGGVDFSDANRFGGFMAAMLFVAGAQFLRTNWLGRCVCTLAGGFIANAVILTRSRGALLAIGGGALVAAVAAPRKYRLLILSGLCVAGLGVFFLSDPQVRSRAVTVRAAEEERDRSAQSRLEIWEGGLKMLLDHPLGVGPGNFYQKIGYYAPDHPGRDAHNTFVRCAGELGFPGLILLVWIVVGAMKTSWTCIARARNLESDSGRDLMWMSYGNLTALVAMLTYGMTGTLVYTEYLWWMLGLPVCLQRAIENEASKSSWLGNGSNDPGLAMAARGDILAGQMRNGLRDPHSWR